MGRECQDADRGEPQVSQPSSTDPAGPRPKIHYPSPIPIRMSKGLREAVDREAATRGISRSALIKTWIREKLEGEVLSGEEMEHLED